MNKLNLKLLWQKIFSRFGMHFAVFFLIKITFFLEANLEESCAHLILKAEYLYFYPTFDNDFIASPVIEEQASFILQPGGPGKRHAFNEASGCRLSFFYLNPLCPSIQKGGVKFTFLPAHHKKKFPLDTFLSLIPEAKILASHHLNYYAGDLFITIPIFQLPQLSLEIEPGLHYAYMNYNNHLSIKRILLDLKEKSETKGLGPQLEFILNYQLYKGISIKGGVKGGLLFSKAKAGFRVKSLEGLNEGNPRSLMKVFPYWQTTLAINFALSLGCLKGELGIGYEYLTYPNYINRIQFQGKGSNKIENVFSSFDFQGPFFSFLFSF